MRGLSIEVFDATGGITALIVQVIWRILIYCYFALNV